jgi:glycosyltransferase involved in cell wall biosynthesis
LVEGRRGLESDVAGRNVKISVVTVARNSASTVAGTVESVLAQAFQEIEHIVIDGASTDATLEIVNKVAKGRSKVISEPDGGIYEAMNKGLRLATGDVIGFLNSDDCYADSTVVSQIADVFQDDAVDACYADLIYVSDMRSKRIVRYWRGREYRDGLSLRGWMPAHPTFYVRRRVFERCGAFDTEFRRQADFELALRLLERYKISCVYVPRIWVHMLTGGMSNNSVLGIVKGNVEAYRACAKNGFHVTPMFLVTKLLSRVPQFFLRP